MCDNPECGEDHGHVVVLCAECAPKPNPKCVAYKPGWFIGSVCKIAIANEHVWVLCYRRDDCQLYGVIDCEPINDGVSFGDPVTFTPAIIEEMKVLTRAEIFSAEDTHKVVIESEIEYRGHILKRIPDRHTIEKWTCHSGEYAHMLQPLLYGKRQDIELLIDLYADGVKGGE